MIEINLVPDVKQELIRARHVRTVVVSSAVTVGLVALGIVILLAIYTFGVQTVRANIADEAIKTKSKELAGVSDLANTLTIQHQLSRLSELYEQTNVDSRFFDLLAAINPPAPNQVSFSLARFDAETKTIRLEGQATNGYAAADVLKRRFLEQASVTRMIMKTKTAPLTDEVAMTDLSYGEDSSGKKVLRFTVTFIYDDTFFARSSQDAVIVRPDRQNATDSFLRLPESLFGDRAGDQEGLAMDSKPTTGLRKRQQILRANQVMFLWVAGVSIVVGFSLVLMIFLVQRIWFNERIIAEKNKTVTTLEKNLSVIPQLKDNIRVLNTNENLMATRLNDSDSALQSVLDALPADANSTAMASSLQTRLLSDVPGVTIESLKVNSTSETENSEAEEGTIGFSFAVSTVSANQNGLRQIFTTYRKSIRPFTINSLSVESQGSRVVMLATGVGYYEPAQGLELKSKVLRP